MRLLKALMFAWTSIAAMALAAEPPFAGVYSGLGRKCDGRLEIRAQSISWQTPFAHCGRRPFRIVEDRQDASALVFQIKGRACDFGVIRLSRDPAYPAYWIATGFRTLEDYRKNSDDALKCSLEKR